jgi:hypothetical protein
MVYSEKYIRRHDVQRRHSNCIIRDAEGRSRGLLVGSVPERAWRGKKSHEICQSC